MKTLFLLLLAFTTLAHGQNVFVHGAGDRWYSAADLEQTARDYTKQKKIDFNFELTERNVWVPTSRSNIIASVSFSSGMGEPILRVDIDRAGKAVAGHLWIASCGRVSGCGYVGFSRTTPPQRTRR
jgi:hypothetical protein